MAAFPPSPQQNLAIQFQGDMVVVASPGSGKTSVVSNKVRNLVSSLRPYQGVIAISFTNKASDELKHRCKAGAFDVKRSFFGTIDDFCLREIVFPFVRQLMPVAAALTTVKLSDLPPAVEELLPATSPGQATIGDTASFLPFLLKSISSGFVPLEVLGMLACHVVDKSDACQKYLKARYRAVFIDEYQDSGYFQHHLFLRIRSLGMTAVAVGDADQSIYKFAHKDSRYLQELTAQNSGFSMFAITTNFRSHISISDFASRLLNQNHPLTPTNDNRVFIKTVQGDQSAIGNWLGTAIPTFMAHYQVATANKVAILFRHQNSARLIADSLVLPYHLFEENPFKSTPAVELQIFSDLLRLRCDPTVYVETLIGSGSANKRALTELRSLRRSLAFCRVCNDQQLPQAIFDAATQLLGRAPSAVGVAELAGVCGDPSKLRYFHKPSADAVQIMTLHKAKGLEFDLVFHADLYDHVLPAREYPPEQRGVVHYADEIQCLNLHYVGVTRAVMACILITSTSRLNNSGQIKMGAASQFIGRNGTSAIPINW